MANNALKVALTFTAIDAASTVVKLLENRILGMGGAAKQVQRDFESMRTNMQAGLQALAASYYTFNSLMKGVHISADLEEAMTNLENSLAGSYRNAGKLHEELAKVREVTGKIQEIFPYGQKQFVEAANVFAQSGMKPQDMTAPRGALYGAGQLATLAKSDPATMAREVANIGSIFGLKASQFGDVSDWMTRIHYSTLLKVPDMAEAMQEPGQLAKSRGINYKDFFTALATLRQHGVDPSRAGDEFAEFLTRLTQSSKKQLNAMRAAGLHFYEHGKRLTLPAIIEELQDWLKSGRGAHMAEQKRDALLNDIFGQRGERSALTFAQTGVNSFEDIETRAEKARSPQKMIKATLEDFNTQMSALKGTAQTATADVLDPMLHTLTAMVKEANSLVEAIDQIAVKHRTAMKAVDTGVEIGVAGGAAYGLLRLIKGLSSGGKVLKAFLGKGSTAAGVAEGKVLEKVAGVTPVFVTGGHLDGMGGGEGGKLYPASRDMTHYGQGPWGGAEAAGAEGSLEAAGAGGALEVAGEIGMATVAGPLAAVLGAATAALYALSKSKAATERRAADWNFYQSLKKGPHAPGILEAAAKADKGLRAPNVLAAATKADKGPHAPSILNASARADKLPRVPSWVNAVAEAGKKVKSDAGTVAQYSIVAGRLDRLDKAFAGTLNVDDARLEAVMARLSDSLNHKPKNDIHLAISIDQNGRVTSTSNDPNTRATITLKRGRF